MSLIKSLLDLNQQQVVESDDDHDHDEDDQKSFDEMVDEFLDAEGFHSLEGRRGLTALCTLVGALGYTDRSHSMQLTASASVGDLVNFLEDNSGAIEELIEWIKRHGNHEWESNLKYED